MRDCVESVNVTHGVIFSRGRVFPCTFSVKIFLTIVPK